MARKKKTEIIDNEPIINELKIINYKFKIHDRVTSNTKGNSNPSGTGIARVLGIGSRYIKNIIEGAPYPYELSDSSNYIIGYGKEEDLEVI